MLRTIQILLILVLCVSVDARAVDNYLNTDTTLKFDNTNYILGWSSHPQEFQYIQEYFPKGQSADNFKDMLSVWVLVDHLSAQQFIQNMVNNYEKRKETDSCCNYATYESGDEYMFDCILSESDGGYLNKIEFNIYRCKDAEIDGKKILLICFYSGQATDDDITPFLKGLKERRLQLTKAMINFKCPKIMIK